MLPLEDFLLTWATLEGGLIYFGLLSMNSIDATLI
jgi:hypothetical protein